MASFRKRGKTWEYRIRYTNKQTGRPDEVSKGGFSTKSEARAAANLVEIKLRNHGFSESTDTMLIDFVKEYMEIYKKPSVKISTYNQYMMIINTRIEPQWKNHKLKDITRNDYQRWINTLSEELSENTVKTIHRIMNIIFSAAVHDFNFLYANPISRVKMPKNESQPPKIACFTKEELNLFLKSCNLREEGRFRNAYQYHTLFHLLSRSGLRIGECVALTWNDVDFDNKTLDINKGLTHVGVKSPIVNTPKTKSSVRKILLDQQTIDLLKKHKREQMQWVFRETYRKKSELNLIFHNEHGKWLKPNVLRDYFQRVCELNNLPMLSPHALRHTHAVHLLETGVNIKYVSERLGHSSIEITADTYLHVTKKIESDAIHLYESYMQR